MYIPYQCKKKNLVRIDKFSSPAHIDQLRNAVDFVAPRGIPVLAVADGIITYIKGDSNIGGPNLSYWTYSNFITIKHPNGEYSRYDHLEYRSSNVKLNQTVHTGEPIARIGMTGYTYIPHLHFQVFVFTGYNIWTDYETLEIKNFKNEV